MENKKLLAIVLTILTAALIVFGAMHLVDLYVQSHQKNAKTLAPSRDEMRAACLPGSFRDGYHGFIMDDASHTVIWGHGRNETLRRMRENGISCKVIRLKFFARKSVFKMNGVHDPKLKAFFAKRQKQYANKPQQPEDLWLDDDDFGPFGNSSPSPSPEIQKERKRLQRAEIKELREQCEADEDGSYFEKCSHLVKIEFHEKMLPHLRPADANDYRRWLVGFLKKGGKATIEYDYPFLRDKEWYVATSNLTLVPSYGVQLVCIIIPKGIKVYGEENFYTRLYYMEDFKPPYADEVPLYSDIN